MVMYNHQSESPISAVLLLKTTKKQSKKC